MYVLGLDTSNYATSAAVFDGDRFSVCAFHKSFLSVEAGKTGLRQNDAVFLHTKNLPEAIADISGNFDLRKIAAVAYSARPRDREDSYMPCFLCGLGLAQSLSAALGVPAYGFSHQAGHVMAALFGTGFARESKKDFLAFHVSGGTTDGLRCALDADKLGIETAATSLDLFAGQAVDRIGCLLGLGFPAGPAMSALAAKGTGEDFMRPSLKGADCCLSGLENQCRARIEAGAAPEDVARYCLLSVAATILAMTRALDDGGDVIYAGGVMSSELIRAWLAQRVPRAKFCSPAYLSADNAVGTAILGARAVMARA
ncbi:MAG: glycoprotease [Oscillospiraceae bacterium]|nr:glycoprotease [Oscillospiraceae bacterium]